MKASKATRFKITDDGESVRVYMPEHSANIDAGEPEWMLTREVASAAYAREQFKAPHFVEVFPDAPAFEGSRARAARIANKAGGYSEDRFASWDAVAAMLCRRGYSDREAVAIMVSKWTRWACDGDEGHAYGRHTAGTLARFLDRDLARPGTGAVSEQVEDLTRETFGDDAGPDWR